MILLLVFPGLTQGAEVSWWIGWDWRASNGFRLNGGATDSVSSQEEREILCPGFSSYDTTMYLTVFYKK